MQWCPITGQEAVNTSWKHRRFQLNQESIVDSAGGTDQWYRLPREAGESPSLDVPKSHPGMVLSSQLLVALVVQGGWTR